MIAERLDDATLAARLAAMRSGTPLVEHKTVAPTPVPRIGVVRDPSVHVQNLSDIDWDNQPREESVTAPEPAPKPDPIAEVLKYFEPAPVAEPVAEPAPTPKHSPFRFAKPLWTAAEKWMHTLRSTEERWMLGLPAIDAMTRGFGNGELVYVTGFAHSGKTQVFLTAMLHNTDKPTVLFTFDEPAELVLAKLVGMRLGRDGEALEAAVKAGDPATLALVRDLAEREFKNLMVIDEPLGLSDMTVALEEAELHFGRPVEAVGIDYLELLRTEGESEVEAKSRALKRWTKQVMLPVICLHQGSRGNAGKGQELTLQSMRYGGEAEGTFVIGVRRKRDEPEMNPSSSLWDTVTVSVIKNKRPPSRKGTEDFYMDPSCGAIRPIGSDPHHPIRTIDHMAGKR